MNLATASDFTLGDLLDCRELGLALATGDERARERVVAGAHCIEVRRPAQWLEPDWVMLTTGLELKDSERAQRDLVTELSDAGVAALGFGVGVVHEAVPKAMLRSAERASFPIFTIPPPRPFWEVARTVERNVLLEEARTFGRLVAVQRFLTDALGSADPAAAIVERLASLLDVTVSLVDSRGVALVGGSDAHADAIGKRIDHRTSSAVRIEETDFSGWIFPVEETGASRWLVMQTRSGYEHPLLKPAAHIAIPLLHAVSRLDELRNAEDRAVRRATLDAVIDADDRVRSEAAGARVALWGLDWESGLRLIIGRLRPVARAAAASLLESAETALEAGGAPWLAGARGDDLAFLVGEGDWEESARLLLELHPHLLLGVGRQVLDPAEICVSQTDAELTLRGTPRSDPNRILRYEDLDLGAALVSSVDPGRVDELVQRWLDPVLENELIHETLLAYLQNDLDVGRTSRVLKLHPNSTRYRLTRLEKALGAPLRRPSTIAALHLALLVRGSGIAPGSAIAGA